jgi:uncharacterized protein YxeA
MKKQLMILIIVLFIIVISVSGCTNEGDNQADIEQTLLGTWKDSNSFYQSYTFFSNGTCTINGALAGTYQLNGENLTITYPGGGKETFGLLLTNENTLRLTNVDTGYIRVYERQ